MKRRIPIFFLFLLGTSLLSADIAVRINSRTDTASQVKAQNLLLRELFRFDDIYVVDELEDYRIDLLVRDIVAADEKVAGHTLALYLFARIDWPTAGARMLSEGIIGEEELPTFDKLTEGSYFPLFFWSDYCTPDALGASVQKIVDFLDENFFEKSREQANGEETPANENTTGSE